MANYGDVRLNLPADWSRDSIMNGPFINSTVGHKNGVAEARLEKNPEQRHAFTWADPIPRPGHPDDVQNNLDDGYVFVKKDSWIKERWRWDAEGFLVCDGQQLMAMTEEKWIELEAKREKQDARSRPADPADDPKLQEMAERVKVIIDKENQPHKRARG